MSESVSRYPLEWPVGWKRTPATERKVATFSRAERSRVDGTGVIFTSTRALSVFDATQRLEMQVERLGGDRATLSTNVSLRLDGRPRSNEGEPRDPGAALYFSFRGKATVFACDRYTRVADNIAAIAAHIDALRRVERYGVGSLDQALAGYKALPADTAANWRAVFGMGEDRPVTLGEVEAAYRERARTAHPDTGGSHDAMAHLNRARDYARAELT